MLLLDFLEWQILLPILSFLVIQLLIHLELVSNNHFIINYNLEFETKICTVVIEASEVVINGKLLLNDGIVSMSVSQILIINDTLSFSG